MPTLPFSGALVTRSTDLTCTNDTFTEITWDTVEYDTDSYWSAGAPKNLTIPTTGYYIAGVIVRWKATNNGAGAGVRNCAIHPNGQDPSLHQGYAELEWPSSTLTGALVHQSCVMPPRYLTAGDYLRGTAYQYSTGGGSLDVDANESRTPAFWIMRVG